MMYGKILVPFDGSERGEKVLPYIEDLARQFKSEVLLLHVLEMVPERLGLAQASLPIEPKVYDAVYQDALSYLTRIQGSLSRIGVVSSIHLMWGPVVPTIVEFAGQEKVHLVAMASHGRTGLARAYYGSVAAGVLHRIDRPLLLVRSASSTALVPKQGEEEEATMSEITERIMSEIESDTEIDAKTISLDVVSQGFLKKRRILRINGMVESVDKKNEILQIVRKRTGRDFDIEDNLIVA